MMLLFQNLFHAHKDCDKIFYSYIDLYTHHWNIPQTLIVKLLFSVCTFHDGCKQGINQQIFNRKSISRKITYPQEGLRMRILREINFFQKWCYTWVDTGGPIVYPWVTHRNPCPMKLYLLNWVKYAWCYNISKPQGLKVSISQVIDLWSQTTKFFMNFLLQWTQKMAVFKHS